MASDIIPGPDGSDVVSVHTTDEDRFVAVFDDGVQGRETPPIKTTYLYRVRARAMAHRLFLKRK